MKVIYPEETLAMLAECDKHLEKIRQEYLQPLDGLLPSDPDQRARLLADPVFQARLHEKTKQQRDAPLSDAFYQGFIHLKAKIIGQSTCTYQFDAEEVARWKI